jgi:hypothetical protein
LLRVDLRFLLGDLRFLLGDPLFQPAGCRARFVGERI